MLDFYEKEGILRKLGALNADLETYKAPEKLGSKLHVVLIGGAGLILRYGLSNAPRGILRFWNQFPG